MYLLVGWACCQYIYIYMQILYIFIMFSVGIYCNCCSGARGQFGQFHCHYYYVGLEVVVVLVRFGVTHISKFRYYSQCMVSFRLYAFCVHISFLRRVHSCLKERKRQEICTKYFSQYIKCKKLSFCQLLNRSVFNRHSKCYFQEKYIQIYILFLFTHTRG